MTSESAEDYYKKGRLKLNRKLQSYRGLVIWLSAIGVIISFTGVVSPRNTYIRCNDASISHDLQKDSISLSMLLVVSLFAPLVIMMIFEWLNLHRVQLPSPLHKGTKRAWSFFLSLLVGTLFSLFLIEVLKTAVSEPRPHFMTSCSPNLTEELCQKQWIHIAVNNCSNPLKLHPRQIIDSMKSFPSGHAAIGVFSAVYMTMYIQRRVQVSWSTLLVAWFQLVWWTWAILCCASRVWDNRHHWWDVLGGGILGGVGGYATVVYLCSRFEEDQKERFAGKGRIPIDQESPSQMTPTKEKNGHYVRPFEMEETASNHTASEPIIQ